MVGAPKPPLHPLSIGETKGDQEGGEGGGGGGLWGKAGPAPTEGRCKLLEGVEGGREGAKEGGREGGSEGGRE